MPPRMSQLMRKTRSSVSPEGATSTSTSSSSRPPATLPLNRRKSSFQNNPSKKRLFTFLWKSLRIITTLRSRHPNKRNPTNRKCSSSGIRTRKLPLPRTVHLLQPKRTVQLGLHQRHHNKSTGFPAGDIIRVKCLSWVRHYFHANLLKL